MNELNKTVNLLRLLQELIKEASYFVNSGDNPHVYESTLVIHVHLQIFTESFGAENLETSGDTHFRDMFWSTYEELQKEYQGKNPQTETRWKEFLILLFEQPKFLQKLPNERLLYAFFEAALKDNIKEAFIANLIVDKNAIYSDIKDDFKLKSVAQARATVKDFAINHPRFNLLQWRSEDFYDELELFVQKHDDV